MVLSDSEIREKIVTDGLISVQGLDYDKCPEVYEQSLQPASYDLRLGNNFKRPVPSSVKGYNSFNDEIEYENISTEDGVIIRPHSFLLGTSVEYIKLPNDLTAFVEGRSSIGRMGLFIQNAGWVDPGFEGEITFELFNASDVPIMLTSGNRIAQLVFVKMSSDCERPYRGKYQGQRGATESRIHKDREMF